MRIHQKVHWSRGACDLCMLLWLGLSSIVVAGDRVEETLPDAPFAGRLYLIGGDANVSLQRFVELAGGEQAVIAVLPHASGDPVEAADAVSNLLAARKVKNIVSIMPDHKGELPKQDKPFTAIFFTGGDQNRLLRVLDPALKADIHKFLKEGGLVGGTSAGAAAMPARMIAGGMSDGLIKTDSLLLGDGLGFLPGFITDTHVRERGRQDRLAVALSMLGNADLVGIGLDEDTAVEISATSIRVWGKGHARFMSLSGKHKDTLGKGGKDDKASVFNILSSVLSEGEEWSKD